MHTISTMTSTSTPPIFSLLLLTLLFNHRTPLAVTATATPYLSKTTLFSDYQKMITTFRIFIYPNNNNLNLNETLTPPLSLFYTALLNSNFITTDPRQAHLFFLPFPPQSSRSLARYIQMIRSSYPYWDRSLGADHFYLSCRGVGPASSRNVVELKKNALQVSCFPLPIGEFIPHKDITLPPILLPPRADILNVSSKRFLGYLRYNHMQSATDLINGLQNDSEFMIESEPSDEEVYLNNSQQSKFCLFEYHEQGLVGLSVALVHGCIPVVITSRPIQDFPLMDVIKWSDIALFVGSNVGPTELKQMLKRTCENGECERRRGLGVTAAQHMVWNGVNPKPYDAFYMSMYQIWVRRHAIRYARWDVEAAST